MVGVFLGDITKCTGYDGVVNAANSGLAGGGGVDGAIHRAAGPGLHEACMALGGCPTGEAKITEGFAMPCRYLIHAVGPVWRGGGQEEAWHLARCHVRAVELAAEYGCTSLVFPCISAGVYRYPKAEAARIAVGTLRRLEGELERTDICCFDRETYGIYQRENLRQTAAALAEALAPEAYAVYLGEDFSGQQRRLRGLREMARGLALLPDGGEAALAEWFGGVVPEDWSERVMEAGTIPFPVGAAFAARWNGRAFGPGGAEFLVLWRRGVLRDVLTRAAEQLKAYEIPVLEAPPVLPGAGACAVEARRARRLAFCRQYLPLLRTIAADPALAAWCRAYRAETPPEEHRELAGMLEIFVQDAYEAGVVDTHYGEVLRQTGLTERSAAQALPEQAAGWDARQLRAALSAHFRAEGFVPGSLIRGSVGGGRMLRLMEAYERVLAENILPRA